MAFSEILAQRIRKAVNHLPMEERKMFGSLAFLVNGKMCLTVGAARIMCRINPELHVKEVKKNGCSTDVMRGRDYKGYIHVQEKNLKAEQDFDHWITLAVDFNKQLTAK